MHYILGLSSSMLACNKDNPHHLRGNMKFKGKYNLGSPITDYVILGVVGILVTYGGETATSYDIIDNVIWLIIVGVSPLVVEVLELPTI